MSLDDAKRFVLGKKVTHFTDEFDYLSANYISITDRDKFVEIDTDDVFKAYAKDKDILKRFVATTFNIEEADVDFTIEPCSMLLYNRARDVYTFIYGSRA